MKRRRGAGLKREPSANRLSRQPGFHALFSLSESLPRAVQPMPVGSKDWPNFKKDASALGRREQQV